MHAFNLAQQREEGTPSVEPVDSEEELRDRCQGAGGNCMWRGRCTGRDSTCECCCGDTPDVWGYEGGY